MRSCEFPIPAPERERNAAPSTVGTQKLHTEPQRPTNLLALNIPAVSTAPCQN